ncbi:Cytochrome c oxidase assembly protein cox19 [Elasticomyces elasticus]|nr:Cytochrome c oxidase assembly protein cox19 [Elasticomyces elasticus]KAK3644315.1 Cytochrome c oxidase assembly protein cox19 [Elasticomyces elasticus]KAK4908294.1 Cytochrome c oxidase assembly protein cox19 [Elasticomyces elasticus]
MSTFGGPGGRMIISKPSPPERGSFPLDHEAECQPIMKQYLRCLRAHRGINDDECRQLSKGNLMAVDSMRNLGYQEPEQLNVDSAKGMPEKQAKADGK